MFGTHLLDRRSKPERIADQAWEYLLSAAGSAKDTARSAGQRTSHVADDASSVVGSAVGSAADEAMRRASCRVRRPRRSPVADSVGPDRRRRPRRRRDRLGRG